MPLSPFHALAKSASGLRYPPRRSLLRKTGRAIGSAVLAARAARLPVSGSVGLRNPTVSAPASPRTQRLKIAAPWEKAIRSMETFEGTGISFLKKVVSCS